MTFERLAVVGASGAVGREILSLLDGHALQFEHVSLFGSPRSAGTELVVRGQCLTVEAISADALKDVSLALFSAGTGVSRDFAPVVAENGGVVIDNSSAFRMDPKVPLVVPEINAADIAGHRGIIANPNCTSIILLMALAPLHRAFGVERVVISTYQAASGAGWSAMEELRQQTREFLNDATVHPKVFRHRIAFNLFSHDSAVEDNGYNGEEAKVMGEVRKILHEPGLPIAITCVRVPVLRAHCESLTITFREPVTENQVREALSDAPGVRIVDDRKNNHFPMPVEAEGGDDVLVGRIRQDLSQPDGRGVALFVCGDQLRKGAALNAVQIAEHLGANSN